MSFMQAQEDCVCTICTCQRCKCPADHESVPYGDIPSTYETDYKRRPYQRPEKPSKKVQEYQPRPFHGQSTFQSDFLHWNVPKVQAIRPGRGAALAEAPFEGSSTAHSTYTRWSGRLGAKPIRKDRKFEYTHDDRDFGTTFGRDFTPKVSKTEMCRPQAAALNNTKFEGEATYKTDFQRWNARPARKVDRNRKYRRRVDDRSFMSETMTNYNPKERLQCPAKRINKDKKGKKGHIRVGLDRNGKWQRTGVR